MPDADNNVIIEAHQLQDLIAALTRAGYDVIAPTVQDEAIVYDRISAAAELPRGWTDEQDGGHYRLKRRNDQAYFGYAVGPTSWKKFLFPPRERLWRAERSQDSFAVTAEPLDPPRYAFLGVRACELAAIAVQDRVFLEGTFVDPTYQARREPTLLIAVQCAVAGDTCFCASMGSGPKAKQGYDLALTEIISSTAHYFVVTIGTERGAQLLRDIRHQPATVAQRHAAAEVSVQTAQQMGRTMDTTDIHALLTNNYEHPRWDKVAARCLTCANCTLVCPTCFCSTVEDVTDLTGDHTERWRQWDSCFTMDFSYLHGVGSVRASTKSRYRQWLTHKLATWIDQFGTSGCVGCGRCISWCPVGIDITEEVAAIRKEKA